MPLCAYNKIGDREGRKRGRGREHAICKYVLLCAYHKIRDREGRMRGPGEEATVGRYLIRNRGFVLSFYNISILFGM